MALRQLLSCVVKQRLPVLNGCIFNSQRCLSVDSSEERLETALAGNMMDIGTRKIFTEEHDIFRQNVRRFFQHEVAPHHQQWEKDGQVSREVWLKAGEFGLLGIDCPTEFGGPGGDWLMATIPLEEQSYSRCSGPGFGLHSNIVLPYIYKFGSKEQIEKYVPRMLKGTCIGAIAMTEPSAGSDLQGIKTHARRDGSDWILNGSKVFISNGFMADLVIVVALTDAKAKSAAHGISLFLVDAGTPGFRKGRKLEKIGLKAQDTAELFFDDVRLPASAVLGELNRGFLQLMSELPQERLMIGTWGLASCEWMFEEARAYVKQRKAFGRTISALQTVQHKLAEIKTDVCIGRVYIDHLNRIHNDSKLDSVQASMAKYWVTAMEHRIASECLQFHGGWGYMLEFPIAKAFVDSRAQIIYGGTNEIMKELIARQIVTDK